MSHREEDDANQHTELSAERLEQTDKEATLMTSALEQGIKPAAVSFCGSQLK